MDPVVSLTTGWVRGRVTGGVSAFLGIPYAAAPVGPARFDAPRPAQPWDGVREATALEAMATQAPYAPPIARAARHDEPARRRAPSRQRLDA
jgi:para-nitrobenzyl esterase